MALTVDVVLWMWGLWWGSELKAAGVEVNVITIGRKGTTYYKSRTKLLRSFEMGQVRAHTGIGFRRRKGVLFLVIWRLHEGLRG